MMPSSDVFNGFPKEALSFFQGLIKNNNKEWFEEHRTDYQDFVLEPARKFILALGGRLKKIAPDIQADPRVNKSIFRINRDTRFSADKSPYKNHLGLWFWEGNGKRMECSGFYFHLEPEKMFVGTGLYRFSKEQMDEYRQSVVHKRYGPALVEAVTRVDKNGAYTLGGRHYKKTPRGFDPDHEHAEYLLYNGLHAGLEIKPPREVHSADLVQFCYDHYKNTLPLHQWLLKLTARAAGTRG